MGRNKDLSRAADVLPNLKQELKRLRQALSEFVDAHSPVGPTSG